jgi:hypothetical protein
VIGDVQEENGKGKRDRRGKTSISVFLVVPLGTTQLIETGVLETKPKSGFGQGGDLFIFLKSLTASTLA